MRPYYTEYVNHILRFYTRHVGMTRFKTEADRLNYQAACKVFFLLSDDEVSILKDVYTKKDTLGDNIYEVAKLRRTNQEDIYTLISRVTNLIAKERRLI